MNSKINHISVQLMRSTKQSCRSAALKFASKARNASHSLVKVLERKLLSYYSMANKFHQSSCEWLVDNTFSF